jgi:predicted nucleotidyltransferase
MGHNSRSNSGTLGPLNSSQVGQTGLGTISPNIAPSLTDSSSPSQPDTSSVVFMPNIPVTECSHGSTSSSETLDTAASTSVTAALGATSSPSSSSSSPGPQDISGADDQGTASAQQTPPWAAAALKSAAMARAVAKWLLGQNNVIKVSEYFTKDAKDWVEETIDSNPELRAARDRVVAAGIRFTVVLLGSYSRNEMAPYSDMDFIVLAEREDPLVEEFGRRLNSLQAVNAHHGGFSMDPAIDGLYQTTPAGLVQRAQNRDMAVAYESAPGVGAELFNQFLEGRRSAVTNAALLNAVETARRNRWDAIGHPKRSILASEKKPDFDDKEINVKNDLLRFLITTTAPLVEYCERTQQGAPSPPMPTVERIRWLAQYGPPDLQKALNKGLAKKLIADFEALQAMRYELHFKNGSEVDVFRVRDVNKKWLLTMLDKDFRAYNEILAKFFAAHG